VALPLATHEFVTDGVTALVAFIGTRAVLSRQVVGAFSLRVPTPHGPLHPPTQEATAVKPWRNVQRVSSEASAKEDMLRRVSPKILKGPRL
jgi:hypothetical protein